MNRSSRSPAKRTGRSVPAAAPAEVARLLVGSFLDERDAVEGARVAHGAISDKYRAAAVRQREARARMWHTVADHDAVVQALVELSAGLLDELSGSGRGRRSVRSWLDEVAGTGESSLEGGG